MNKVVRNSILSIIVGVIISIGACYSPVIVEPINYVGAMFVFGGLVFLDQIMLNKILDGRIERPIGLIRLPVYLLLAVVLIMMPMYVEMQDVLMRIARSFGIALFLLALWRFFTFTTVGQQK